MDPSLPDHPRSTPDADPDRVPSASRLMPGNRIARIMSRSRLSPAIIFSLISLVFQ
jgi:hypothetical protein